MLRAGPVGHPVVVWPEYAGEVAAAADAPDDQVRVVLVGFHLRLRLLAYHGLAGEDEVHDAPHGVLGRRVALRVLQGFALRDAHRPGRVRVFLEDVPPYGGPHAGARDDLRPPCLGEVLPVWLAIVARL